ncbi:MAG: BMP family ABC transporter substrate-binding protein [Schwartzia succinivorans]|nr:BMP family ABC transporter substrate-binding protein [Schwartzia succinivorans]
MKISEEKRLEKRQRHFIMGLALLVLLCIGVSVAEFHTEPKLPRPKIGVIMRGTKDQDGWNKVQYEGLRDAAKELGMDVIVKENTPRLIGDYKKIIDSLVSQGVHRIVFTWHRYPPELRELLRQYPNLEFILQTTEFSEDNMLSCSTRLFEVQYLAGLIAGYQTKTGVVGYVAPFSCVEVNRGLNAFVIGVKRANPSAHIKVAWTNDWDVPERERAAVDALAMEEVDVLSYQQDGRAVADAAERQGIDYIDAHEVHPEHVHCLTAVQSDWRTVYRNLLSRHIRKGKMANANNYLWQGFLEHIVTVAPLSERVTPRAREEISRSVRDRAKGERLIYGGEIYDSNNVKRCDAKEILSNEYLRVHMNWLVKGVEQVE